MIYIGGRDVTFETIRSHLREDGVLLLPLSRPDRLNALTLTMVDELEAFFGAVNRDDAVRAIGVTGEERASCAGMQLAAEGNVFLFGQEGIHGELEYGMLCHFRQGSLGYVGLDVL